LQRVSTTAGYVISIEGPWGCGKTTVLSMMEQVLRQREGKDCTIVQFNPWLVGERNALIGQFLGAMAKAIELGHPGKDARNAAKELRNYSKVFDLIKFIPGAEPWATIVKGVMQAAGNAADGLAEQKERDLEAQKVALEQALAKLDRKIYVFVDDVDRLYPTEVFEVVRIIKAAGDLPNVGYVVAWDADYVTKALEAASVPLASAYVDKVVQVRLPVPALSEHDKIKLFNKGLESLDPKARDPNFPKHEERLQEQWFAGLSQFLEHPRDVTRLFNTVSVIEPALRGEIVLADIIGLALMMLKTPTLYTQLRKDPDLFTAEASPYPDDQKALQKAARAKFEPLCEATTNPDATRKLVQHLFPAVAKATGGFTTGAVNVQGHLAAQGRLGIALGLTIGRNDASLAQARQYLTEPSKRRQIEGSLTAENALAFFETLTDMAQSIGASDVSDLQQLSTDLARLIDTQPIASMSRSAQVFYLPPAQHAMNTLEQLVKRLKPAKPQCLALSLASDPLALTIAARVVHKGLEEGNDYERLACSATDQLKAAKKLVANTVTAIAEGRFWTLADPARALWTISEAAPTSAKRVFKALKQADPTLDNFVSNYLKYSFNSDGGQTYRFPTEGALLNMVTRTSLIAHAKRRLADAKMTFPTRAAWLAVVSGKVHFGSDGSEAR
jgi:energy-coupling factor transporter ATP-binding protein EcfA2